MNVIGYIVARALEYVGARVREGWSWAGLIAVVVGLWWLWRDRATIASEVSAELSIAAGGLAAALPDLVFKQGAERALELTAALMRSTPRVDPDPAPSPVQPIIRKGSPMSAMQTIENLMLAAGKAAAKALPEPYSTAVTAIETAVANPTLSSEVAAASAVIGVIDDLIARVEAAEKAAADAKAALAGAPDAVPVVKEGAEPAGAFLQS